MRKFPGINRELLFRAGLVVVFVVFAYQFRWEWLRFATSEAILRMSGWMGMVTARLSFDTIRVQGELFEFVIGCTFVDVFMGSIPLIWKMGVSLRTNIGRLLLAAVILFAFNAVRLEIGQVLYSQGLLPYVWADEVLGGIAYFAVWLNIWRYRGSQILGS